MRVIQLVGPGGRRAGVVEEPYIRLLRGHDSIYQFAQQCFREKSHFRDMLCLALGDERLEYGSIHEGKSEWEIALPVEHPEDPARCLVSGTGLTHKASVENRDAMHAAAAVHSAKPVTDSARMYRMGLEGGRPKPGEIGVSPEWFYKGPGSVLMPHNRPLTIPEYAEDGGEEPEVAGVYIIDEEGVPRRIGLTVGNEFSDHLFERRNYLYLAASKLRECSIGPELSIGCDFTHARGEVLIERNGASLWSMEIQTGEAAMCHSVANMEHHHFKFERHRRPGDLHIHYFGADAFSFGDGIQLQDGDVMQVRFDGFGRPLRNPVRRMPASSEPVTVRAL